MPTATTSEDDGADALVSPHPPLSLLSPATESTVAVGKKGPGLILPTHGTAVGMEPGCLTQVFAATADDATASDISMSVGTPATDARVGNLPTTTARKNHGSGGKKRKAANVSPTDKEPPRPNMKVNARVVVERQFIHLRVAHGQLGRDALDQTRNKFANFYGRCMKKSGHSVYLIKFDAFPADAPHVPISRKHVKRVLRPNEEEPPLDRPEEEAREETEEMEEPAPTKGGGKKKARNYAAESIKGFVSMDAVGMKQCREYVQKFGPGPDDEVRWEILSEDQQIVTCPMEMHWAQQREAAATVPACRNEGMDIGKPGARLTGNPTTMDIDPLRQDIPWDPIAEKVDYNSTFFKHFFLDMKGTAEKADRYLSDPRSGLYNTINARGLKPFHQPDRPDPDEKVRTAERSLHATAHSHHAIFVRLFHR